MQTILSSLLPTTQDIAVFQEKLTKAKDLAYKNDQSRDAILTKLLSTAEQKAITAYCKSEKLSLSDATFVETIEKILQQLQDIPELTVTLAFSPSKKLIQKIAEVLHFQFKKNIVLNFQTDPDMVGGATFEFNGKASSFTLEKIVEKALT